MHRLSSVLTRDIPECQVNAAYSHHRDAFAPVVSGRGIHLVHQKLDGEWIRADQEIAKMMGDDVHGGAAPSGHAITGDALRRLDLDDDGTGELRERSTPPPARSIKIGSELRSLGIVAIAERDRPRAYVADPVLVG